MIRKIIRFFIWFIFLALLTTAITFGVLFFIRNNEVSDLQTQNALLTSEKQKLQDDLNNTAQCLPDKCPENVQFEDKAQKLEFEYPASWNLTTGISIGDFAVVGSKQGRLVSELQYTLTKDDAVLKINKVMVATGFIPAPFTGQESDYKELSDELARIRDEEQDVWAYVTITDCVEDETPDGAAFCYATPAPGFGDLASIVTLSASADDEAIAEADEIVLSAQ